MHDTLRRCQLFEGLEEPHIARVAALAERRTLEPGEPVFKLGDDAERVFVVVEGNLSLCLPLSIHGTMKEVVVASEGPGGAVGWSAFVKPYRFRLSAKAAGPAVVAGFNRVALGRLIDEDPIFGRVFLTRVAEVIGRRLLTVQAMWARELQRSVAGGMRPPAEHATESQRG